MGEGGLREVEEGGRGGGAWRHEGVNIGLSDTFQHCAAVEESRPRHLHGLVTTHKVLCDE